MTLHRVVCEVCGRVTNTVDLRALTEIEGWHQRRAQYSDSTLGPALAAAGFGTDASTVYACSHRCAGTLDARLVRERTPFRRRRA